MSESAHSLEAGSSFPVHEKNESASDTRRLIFFIHMPKIFVPHKKATTDFSIHRFLVPFQLIYALT
ncbi:MAG: hypothetical protein FWF77_09260 [Defluviitaleaceae bacterium]|nr:hypothetical protein [Defluviitaleaceae bacterium]